MSNSKFRNRQNDIVFSSFKIEEELWNEDRVRIQWISLQNYDLATMTKTIIAAVNDQYGAKNILVTSYQKFIGKVDVQIIVQHLKEIVRAKKGQTRNKVSLGTALFIPAQQDVWGAVAIFNKEVHKLCDELNISRANVHKAVMREVSMTDPTRMTRPSCWVEYQLGLSVGSSLSWEGCERIKQCILRIFDYGFSNDVYRRPSHAVKTSIPPPLIQTPGYKEDEFMRQVLEIKGFTPRTRSEGARMLRCSEDRWTGWRSWHIFRRNGPMWSFEAREGMLEAYNIRLRYSDSDLVEEGGVLEEPEQPQPVVRKSNSSVDMETKSMDKDDSSSDESSESSTDESSDDTENDNVFIEPEKEKGEKQKTKEIGNENEKLNNMILEAQIKEMQKRLDEQDRTIMIYKEKIKSYKKETESKGADLAKEKTANKHWRIVVDVERERTNQLTEALEKEMKNGRHLKRQNQRLTEEYQFLKGTYESERAKPNRQKLKLKHAKESDFEAFPHAKESDFEAFKYDDE